MMHDDIFVILFLLSFEISCSFIILGIIFHHYSSIIPNYAQRDQSNKTEEWNGLEG